MENTGNRSIINYRNKIKLSMLIIAENVCMIILICRKKTLKIFVRIGLTFYEKKKKKISSYYRINHINI